MSTTEGGCGGSKRGIVKTECKVRAWSQDTSQSESGCHNVPAERMRTVRFLFELERGCCVWEVEEGVIWVSEANKIIKVKRYSCYALVLSPKDADDMVQPGVWARTV